jgi:SAM-dependent methyltransferase
MMVGQPIVEAAALGLTDPRYRELRNVFDVQSFVFACEVMPSLWELYPTGIHKLTLLDVGPRTAAGTALMQYVHHPESFSRIKLKATAIDIDHSFRDYANVHFPEVEYIVGDVFDPAFDRTFDIVMCSHTIEHLSDPLPFLQQLRGLARSWTIVACPFDEIDLIAGHLSSLGYSFFENAGVHSLKVYRSLTWHQSMACVAVFKGNAITV